MGSKKEEVKEEKMEDILDENNIDKQKGHVFVNFLLIALFFIALGYFIVLLVDKDTSIFNLISSLLLSLFSIFFVVISLTYNRNKKGMIGFSTILLIGYFLLGINNHVSFVKTPITTVPDFSGKNLTDVMKWASNNGVTITQEYEYSDMVPEYKIISQDIKKNTNANNLKEMTVSVSEGANPSKEIIIPSMISWDSERVINFIKDNYLSNVIIEFVESDKSQNTLIEQSASGNLKRDDELKLVFSSGEELGFTEVRLIDFTNMSRFEVEFYMKQHRLNYEFDEDFDKTIKKGYVKSQKIKAGEVVPINDIVVNITLSKGPKIKVPELVNYTIEEITEWAIKNKLKLKFSDKYDSEVKENGIISVNKEKDSIVEQGSVIEVVISRGPLKMPNFKSLTDFYAWANKYQIGYEEVHEFSDTVPAGEVISYSYKKGQIIKNDDTIKVIISDGVKRVVPNLKGLSKSEAISKLNDAGLKYSFVYNSSNSVKKNYVINQSISAGSEISDGVTIAVTLSTGPKETNNTPAPEVTQPTTPTCTNYTIRISEISAVLDNYNTCSSGASALKSKLEGKYPGLTVNVTCSDVDGYLTNDIVSGFKGGTVSSCDSISIVLSN